MRTEPPRVLYIPEVSDRVALRERVSEVLRADLDGRFAVMLRAYDWRVRELLDFVRVMPRRSGGPRVLVAGRVDVALVADLDGVHLPARGMSAAEARGLVGEARIVGAACHDEGELRRAAGASYVTLSPVREVPGKGAPLGLDGFARLAALATSPVLALGGIGRGDVRALVERGAHGFAVRRAIDLAPSPSRALREFGDVLEEALAP